MKPPSKPHTFPRLIFTIAAVVIITWIAIAYIALPHWWHHHEEKLHPALDHAPTLTTTTSGIPGDPLNLFIIATETELASALLETGWHPADPVTLRTSLRIAEDAVLSRPYADAPVSPLLLFGRHQDLAFEKPHGNTPRERHHVRFWKAPQTDSQGRIAWWAAATFDRSVGLSHDTGEITHHIAPAIDQDRDLILTDLRSNKNKNQGTTTTTPFTTTYQDNFQPNPTGKNGGGDPWQTDRKLGIAIKQ